MAAELRIWLLGEFRVEVDSRPVPDGSWRRNKAKAVVKLLALAPRHRLHREQLMDLLWPELAPDAAAANLRKAVHFARQSLAPEHLALRDELLRLQAPRLWVDVDAFEAAADARDLTAAIELYAGDLLLEDRFEPWTEERRERLRSRFARLLQERAVELEAAGDLRGATVVGERLAAADPLNEQAVVALMRVYALAGQRHLALGWFRQLEARLAGELGVAPGTEARRLQEEVASGRFPPAPEPAAPAATPPAAAPEERKLVTAMLLDAVPSPPAADPERARLELERWAGLVDELLRSWGGTAERLVGGQVLAVFGIPRVREDDAARALRAALEVIERSPLPVRIGVGTGEVIAPAGPQTSPREIAGEALDDAARLREAAAPGTAVAAERTCRAAGGVRSGEPLRIPTSGGPELRARRVLGLQDAGASEAPRLQGPMIGRDAELGVLLGLFEEVVASGLPRLLTVLGPAGVGKTRISSEAVAAMVTRHPGTAVLQGRCPPAGRDVSYSPLGEILRQACGISLADPAAAVRARLWDRFRAILGQAPASADLDATVFALAATAGIDLPGSPLGRLEPRAVADELARAWPRFASACAAGGPAVFVVEDLHWAGGQLLDMLELMVARSAGPLLVVATARPELAEQHPGFGAGVEGHASVSLRPLGEEHSRTLLERLAPAGRLPAALREEVVRRAEGNPFFLEELVLHLAGGGGGALPDTLHALLAARIDTLSQAEKQVLQQAAVVGRVFWEGPVEHALGGAPVAAHLHGLERRGFILRRPTATLLGQTEFSFRHALIHDVAYASIPRTRRALAHAEVGEWLEQLLDARRDEFAELLAYHFGRAAAGEGAELAWEQPEARERVRARAFAYLLQSGVGARRRFAVAAAVDLHEQALALAGGRRERLLALEQLGDDHDSVYHGDAAFDCYRQALALAGGDPPGRAERARLCRKIAMLMVATPGAFRANPGPETAERYVADGLAAADDEVARAWLLVARGMSAQLWRGSEPFGQGARGDPVPIERRLADVRQALAIAQSAGQADLLAEADAALGVLDGIAGRYGEVLARSRRKLEGLARAGSKLEQADLLRKAAVAAITIGGGFAEGAELARRAHALSTSADPHQRMHATWPLLAALYHLGRWDELPPLVEEHAAAFRQNPAVECQFVRDGPVIGATVLAHLGELERAAALAAMVGDPMAEPETASAWQARFAVACGDPATGRQISTEKAFEGRLYGPQHALSLLEALLALEDWPAVAEFLPAARQNLDGNALLGPFCDRAEGLLHARAGRRPAARRALRRALARFEQLEVPFEAARTREGLAAVEPAPAARSLLEAAMATYQRLGAGPCLLAVRSRLTALA
jgi:DNA-binding SARP family transcriptional activator/tetratricopeptide (TPR) repeat protein